MTTLSAFCERAGIDQGAAEEVLRARRSRDDAPWYMQTVLGIGAWITAIAGLFFAWALMDLVFGIEEPNLPVSVAGAIVAAASIWALHRRPDGAFTAHAAVAFATAGALVTAAGIGMPAESLWAATAATLPFAIAGIWQRRSAILQFVMTSVTVLLAILAAWDVWNEIIVDPPAVFIAVGAGLLVLPPRRDVRPTAHALLVAPLLLSIALSHLDSGWALRAVWPTSSIYLALFASLFVVNWRQKPAPRRNALAPAAAAAAAIVSLSMPSGATGALVLMALGYTLGSRALAVVGTAVELYFIWRFYWELRESELTVSIILMSVGAALLVCYGLLIAAVGARKAS